MRIRPAIRVAILASLTLGGIAGCDDDEFALTPLYNHANGRIVIELGTPLADGEQLFVRARRGEFGTLDCSQLIAEISPIEETSGTSIDGPVVDPALTKAFYNGDEWLDPTPDMLRQLELGVDSIIDVCLMNGTTVVHQVERDLFQAWDAARSAVSYTHLTLPTNREV